MNFDGDDFKHNLKHSPRIFKKKLEANGGSQEEERDPDQVDEENEQYNEGEIHESYPRQFDNDENPMNDEIPSRKYTCPDENCGKVFYDQGNKIYMSLLIRVLQKASNDSWREDVYLPILKLWQKVS